MRFHRISPCPKCGGKVKAKWEEQHYLSALVFRCGGCRYKPYALALKSKPAVEWEWPKDMMLADDVEIMAREKEIGGGQ